MATKRLSQLPAIGSVQSTDLLVVQDGGGVVRKATVSQLPGAGGSGSAWFDGVGAPATNLGADGDYYLDTAVLCSSLTQQPLPSKHLIPLRYPPRTGNARGTAWPSHTSSRRWRANAPNCWG